jgi:hypothetical protein
MEKKELSSLMYDVMFNTGYEYKKFISVKDKALINVWSYLNTIEEKSEDEQKLYKEVMSAYHLLYDYNPAHNYLHEKLKSITEPTSV